ncbi:MAG: hypothetical protein ABWY19_14835 [Marmoricola sp.]
MRTLRHSLLPFALLVPLLLALCGPLPAAHAATSLTNGCTYSARGIPTCGAFLGGAYGSNSDVKSWESSMGKNLGVHRTFWSSGSVASAVKTAKADAAANRVGWMSFTAPYSWTDMAAGKGDAWAKDLATRMKAIGGPVWVAVGHEPENDGGDIQKWKAMQARLAPIMRAAAPNLGYSIILMGYHEFFGDKKFALSAIWPNTKIDVAGFDIYEKYGVKKSSGEVVNEWKDFKNWYFEPIQEWADAKGVAWGLAETGYSDPAAVKKPSWISQTYADMQTYGGIAFSYFNTNLHSVADWSLNTTAQKNAFTAANKNAPSMQ